MDNNSQHRIQILVVEGGPEHRLHLALRTEQKLREMNVEVVFASGRELHLREEEPPPPLVLDIARVFRKCKNMYEDYFPRNLSRESAYHGVSYVKPVHARRPKTVRAGHQQMARLPCYRGKRTR